MGLGLMIVNAYIDGFNLYHSIARLNDQSLKWLNLKALCKCFLKESDTLNRVYYFSALPSHLPHKIARHETYIKALKSTNIMPINFDKE